MARSLVEKALGEAARPRANILQKLNDTGVVMEHEFHEAMLSIIDLPDPAEKKATYKLLADMLKQEQRTQAEWLKQVKKGMSTV
jgi:hypothetical protein